MVDYLQTARNRRQTVASKDPGDKKWAADVGVIFGTWSTNCRWPRFAEEAKNGEEVEKEGTKKFCWLKGLKGWEGLKAGGGVLFGLNADRNTSEDPPWTPSGALSASRLSLKVAGTRVSSNVKSEGRPRPLSPLDNLLSFFPG